MAATVSAWAKPGAWALDSEENEAELVQQQQQDASTKSNGTTAAVPEADFPSLSAAASTKAKKKKAQVLSLQDFNSYGASEKQSTITKGLTPDEILMLPTGPRQRSAEELDRNKLGGGFRTYDSNRSSRGSSDDSRRGGFNRDPTKEFTPSRADETDNWAAGKKSSFGNGFERRERGERGGFFTDSQSRADEVDNWASSKAFVPSEGRRNDRRAVFGSNGGGADSDNWLKKKDDEGPKIGGSFDSLRTRRGGYESINSSDSDAWGRKREEGSNIGMSARPRLNLQPRTKPLGEGQQNGNGEVAKPKGSNPFGEARPREEVLKEKGQDWKEIDEKLEAVKIKEFQVARQTDGKRGFGTGNGRVNLPDNRTERAWGKPEAVEARPSSSEKSENGHVEDVQDGESEGGEPQA